MVFKHLLIVARTPDNVCQIKRPTRIYTPIIYLFRDLDPLQVFGLCGLVFPSLLIDKAYVEKDPGALFTVSKPLEYGEGLFILLHCLVKIAQAQIVNPSYLP